MDTQIFLRSFRLFIFASCLSQAMLTREHYINFHDFCCVAEKISFIFSEGREFFVSLLKMYNILEKKIEV